MAIPVVVEQDVDYEEVLLQQLFADLWNILQQIELIQRSRRINQNLARVSATLPVRNLRRCREEFSEQQAETDRRNPEFVNLGLLLSSSGSIFHSTRRRRFRRTRQAASEEAKIINVTMTVDVIHKSQGEQSAEVANEKNRKFQRLISRLVPSPIHCSLWTAVICMVGWHFLHTR